MNDSIYRRRFCSGSKKDMEALALLNKKYILTSVIWITQHAARSSRFQERGETEEIHLRNEEDTRRFHFRVFDDRSISTSDGVFLAYKWLKLSNLPSKLFKTINRKMKYLTIKPISKKHVHEMLIKNAINTTFQKVVCKG